MDTLQQKSDCSVVTVVLHRQTSSEAVSQLLENNCTNLIAVNSRGTLIKDRWYQSLIPAMNPEQEVMQLIVPDKYVEAVMQQIIKAGSLWRSGAGSVFSVKCPQLWHSEDYTLSAECDNLLKSKETPIPLKQDLVGIFCIAQSHICQSVARAAVKAGGHGPSIYFCEGRGLRDRLGLLRITQNPDKELLQLVVNPDDADAVFDAMAEAGKLDEPGRGIIMSMPVSKGLVNLASVFGTNRNSANLHQIISAIDDLHGHSDWRAQHHHGSSEPRGNTRNSFLFRGRNTQSKRYLTDSVMLTCITKRKHADAMIDTAFSAGIPAATTTFGKFIEANCQQTAAGLRINQERGIIRMVIPPKQVEEIVARMHQAATSLETGPICFFTQAVPKALTYLG